MTDTGTFSWCGKIYPYLSATYGTTRMTERAVEVPIALSLLNEAVNVLEIGAVLPHYLPCWPNPAHTVIDLYEVYPGVVNADVLTYEPDGYFDLIICISTLDHLNNAKEVRTAVNNMKSWLRKDGLLFITIPANQPPSVGGGAWLDSLVLDGVFDMNLTRMDKVSPHNHGWQQVDTHGGGKAYGDPTSFANTLYLLEWWR